ncbi:thioredoxin-like domain-containing protein [uncultured Roseivirga sp.]|uniref:TlpA family protein disulfide reductase n=1 Tax=uncultured Roseivirga sp. TaxID=543088 RepID=UPI0030D838A8|tara:strand:- start:81646 stop:82434 length:789 start_codon:yes stop_codon:yes gene_type:complete
MQRLLTLALCLTLSTYANAQISFELRKADNDETVNISTLIKDKNGDYIQTFLITWSGEWCTPCMDVVKSLGAAAKSGKVQVLAVNIDEDWKAMKANNYHNNYWSNVTNLYVDSDLNNSFDNYFTVAKAPVIMLFDDMGHVKYIDASYSLRSYMFVDYFGKEFIWEDSEGLNSYAWDYYLEQPEDKIIPETDEKMAKALEFVKRSISLNANYNNTDTYAALLYLSGQYTEALKKAKEAIDLAKESDTDYETTNELIQKIIEKM